MLSANSEGNAKQNMRGQGRRKKAFLQQTKNLLKNQNKCKNKQKNSLYPNTAHNQKYLNSSQLTSVGLVYSCHTFNTHTLNYYISTSCSASGQKTTFSSTLKTIGIMVYITSLMVCMGVNLDITLIRHMGICMYMGIHEPIWEYKGICVIV